LDPGAGQRCQQVPVCDQFGGKVLDGSGRHGLGALVCPARFRGHARHRPSIWAEFPAQRGGQIEIFCICIQGNQLLDKPAARRRHEAQLVSIVNVGFCKHSGLFKQIAIETQCRDHVAHVVGQVG